LGLLAGVANSLSLVGLTSNTKTSYAADEKAEKGQVSKE
jgi:hypothetical protein